MVDQFATLTPGSDPVGAAVGGFNQGLGIVEALRKRKRDLQTQQQQDAKTYAEFVNTFGADKAASMAAQLGLDHEQILNLGQAFAGTKSAEERAQYTPSQAVGAGVPFIAGMSPAGASGIGNLYRGQAASASSTSHAKAGDVDYFKSQATLLKDQILNQNNLMAKITATPEEKANAQQQLTSLQAALADNDFLAEVALGVRNKQGGLIGKFRGAQLPSAAAGQGANNPYMLKKP